MSFLRVEFPQKSIFELVSLQATIMQWISEFLLFFHHPTRHDETTFNLTRINYLNRISSTEINQFTELCLEFLVARKRKLSIMLRCLFTGSWEWLTEFRAILLIVIKSRLAWFSLRGDAATKNIPETITVWFDFMLSAEIQRRNYEISISKRCFDGRVSPAAFFMISIVNTNESHFQKGSVTNWS